MGTPSDTRAQRVSTTLTFTNVTAIETARQAVVWQDAWNGSTAIGSDWSLDGWNLHRDGGTDGQLVTQVRFWSIIAAAGSLIHQNTGSPVGNGYAAGEYQISKSLDVADFTGLGVSLQDSAGASTDDQDYKLTMWFVPRRVV